MSFLDSRCWAAYSTIAFSSAIATVVIEIRVVSPSSNASADSAFSQCAVVDSLRRMQKMTINNTECTRRTQGMKQDAV